MSSDIVAAFITATSGIAGALLAVVLPRATWFERLTSKHGKHSLLGTWISEWGPLPEGPVSSTESLTITKHRREQVSGYITWETHNSRKWLFEGRYDGRFLQLIYFPAPDSEDRDFLSHGCYFFERAANGTFVGYSTGYDADDGDPNTPECRTDFHTLRRKR
jgi:hypothetical protein